LNRLFTIWDSEKMVGMRWRPFIAFLILLGLLVGFVIGMLIPLLESESIALADALGWSVVQSPRTGLCYELVSLSGEIIGVGGQVPCP
jgi:hypothetical protein